MVSFPQREFWSVILFVFLILLQRAGAYQEIGVENGGSISGQVFFAGEAPHLPPLPVHKNKAVCDESITNDSLLISPNGGLKNVVVILEGIHVGKALHTTTAFLDNKNCAFVPRVQTLVVGQRLSLLNNDPILHNVHARQNGYETLFNLGLPYWSEKAHRFDKTGHILIDCDVLHTWMQAHIIVNDHPYTAVTNTEGGFNIIDIPAGDYTLRLWHELLGEQRQSVTVTAAQEISVQLTYTVEPQNDKGQ